jgi:hypothetical protein
MRKKIFDINWYLKKNDLHILLIFLRLKDTMDPYDMVYDIIKTTTKPNYNECSRQPEWNDSLTLRFHEENLDWEFLTKSISGSLPFLEEHPILHKYYNWKNITMDLTTNVKYRYCPNNRIIPILYPKLPWDSKVLTTNILKSHDAQSEINRYTGPCNSCFRYIINYPDFPWDWDIVSSYNNIDINFVINNPNLPWNWRIISLHKDIPVNFIETNYTFNWDWNYLTSKISLKFILNHPAYNWDANKLLFKINRSILSGQTNDIIKIYNYHKFKDICDNIDLPHNVQSIIAFYLNLDYFP